MFLNNASQSNPSTVFLVTPRALDEQLNRASQAFVDHTVKVVKRLGAAVLYWRCGVSRNCECDRVPVSVSISFRRAYYYLNVMLLSRPRVLLVCSNARKRSTGTSFLRVLFSNVAFCRVYRLEFRYLHCNGKK